MLDLKRLFSIVMGLLCVASIIAYLMMTSATSHAAPAISGYSRSSESVSIKAAQYAAVPLATTLPTGLVQMGQVTINGQTESVLTTVQGLTLYYDTNDTTATSVTCTGTCAQAWPPLLDPNNTLPPAAAGTSGFTDFNGANGNQVEFNGHPLYAYAQDTAAGQANGQARGNVWFVATMNLTVQ